MRHLTYHEKLVLKMLMIERQHAEVPMYEMLVKNAERARKESPGEEEKRFKKLRERPQTDEDNTGHPIRITPHPGQKKLTVPSLMVNFPEISQPYILIPSDIPPYDSSIYWQMIREQRPTVIIQMASEEPTAYLGFPKVAEELVRSVDTHVLCESVTETDMYIRRDYLVTDCCNLYPRQSNLDFVPHKLIHIQYRHWNDPNHLTNPPNLVKLREFYEFLLDAKLLVTINERPVDPVPDHTATTSCPVLMGSASIFAIIDAIYRMLNFQGKHYEPCIEEVLSKFFIKDFHGLQTPDEILYIYQVLLQILEKNNDNRKRQGWQLKEYVRSWKNEKIINYKKFLTSGKWCPCQLRLNYQLRNQENRKIESDEAHVPYRPSSPLPSVLLPLSTD